jgi:hypothetical protein
MALKRFGKVFNARVSPLLFKKFSKELALPDGMSWTVWPWPTWDTEVELGPGGLFGSTGNRANASRRWPEGEGVDGTRITMTAEDFEGNLWTIEGAASRGRLNDITLSRQTTVYGRPPYPPESVGPLTISFDDSGGSPHWSIAANQFITVETVDRHDVVVGVTRENGRRVAFKFPKIHTIEEVLPILEEWFEAEPAEVLARSRKMGLI